MTTFELDPLFVKALKLLHSKNKDSADQLKQMIDEVLSQRRGETAKKEVREGEKSSTSSGKHSLKEEDKKRDAEKRSFEKLKQDLSDLSSQSGKKPRLDTDKESKEDKAAKVREKEKAREKDKEREKEKDRDREREREKREREKELKEKEKREAEKREAEKRDRDRKAREEAKEVSSESDDDTILDADDFAFDLGIACVVCRSFDVSSGNQLVECQECHSLYHQECHRPAVIEQDVNDPRFVWYCSRCAKTLKKMVAKPKPKPVFAAGVKDNGNNGKPSKSEPTTLFPFRRTEPIKPTTSRDTASSAAKPLSGLASLAANLSGKTSTESSKSKSDLIKHGAAKPDMSKLSHSNPDQHSFAAQLSRADLPERILSSSSHGQKSSSKPSSGSHKSSSSSGGAASAMNADKRLQMMKKKAAAKQIKSLK